jgi:prepilin-type N-terminal cleavage/methylation domain-containing protein/prepilin-type processing-associated H-X9-DG protein
MNLLSKTYLSSSVHSKRSNYIIHGFTLIELLVVVAIISVLVALMLPAMTSARQRAREVVCLSNVRQWSIILQGYQNDYNEYLIPQTGNISWEQVLINSHCLTPDPEIKMCPANRKKVIDGIPANANYVPNAYLWAQYGCLNGNLRLAKSEPEDAIVLAEREHVFLKLDCSNAYHQGIRDGNDVSFLHRGSADFLFLDGHASWEAKTGSYENLPWGINPNLNDAALFYRHWYLQ